MDPRPWLVCRVHYTRIHPLFYDVTLYQPRARPDTTPPFSRHRTPPRGIRNTVPAVSISDRSYGARCPGTRARHRTPLPNQVPRRLVELTHHPRVHHRSILPVRSEHGPVLQDPRHDARGKFSTGQSVLPTVHRRHRTRTRTRHQCSFRCRGSVMPQDVRAGGDVVTIAELSACSTFLSPLDYRISWEEGGGGGNMCSVQPLSFLPHHMMCGGEGDVSYLLFPSMF